MKPPRRAKHFLLALAAIVLSALSAQAALPLKVAFLPDFGANQTMPQPGFQGMYIPIEKEAGTSKPFSQKFGAITVTLSGSLETPGGHIPLQPSRLVTRMRGVSAEGKNYINATLLSSWVGLAEGFSLQIEGLKPYTKYKITFYAYDYPDPGVERQGKDIIHDALSHNAPLILSWDTTAPADKLTAKTPADYKSGKLVSVSSGTGHLLFTIESGIPSKTALINGFELAETR